MVDNVVTDSPKTEVPVSISPISSEINALFDSIAKERADVGSSHDGSPWQTFFTAFLWFGYAIAIGVALVLVWSGSKELLNSLPH